jgi:single-stranded-DNA-specific exonuclease
MQKVWKERISTHTNLSAELGISPLLAKLLSQRKINTVEQAQKFLNPQLKSLCDPKSFKDMEKAAHRVLNAIENNEIIGIFGDYDVDGVSSSAILCHFLTSLGAQVTSTLPNRLSEGYGLKSFGIDRLKKQGASLLICADCGSTAHDAVLYANSLGFDVIVLDHHEPEYTLPEAYALVNPKRADCLSEANYLCAAGVCFFLCAEVRRQARGRKAFFASKPETDLKDLLDLVALATVADVMPLVGHNRVLVKAGLKILKSNKRLGLDALISESGLQASRLSSTNLGFHLGPRINAAGRLDDATLALKLLLSNDESEAKALAHMLNNANLERRALEEETVLEACALISELYPRELPFGLVLAKESWHPGVVGIVASRIAEKYHRPTIIIGEEGKGSGRSIKGIDLHALVKKASKSLSGFGGHSHAIGLSLGPGGLNAFKSDFSQVLLQELSLSFFSRELYYDAEIDIKDLSFATYEELGLLEPFGNANPAPVFLLRHCFLRNLRRLEGGHIKGEIEGPSAAISFIGFRMNIDDSMAAQAIDIIAALEINIWQAKTNLQLRLIDYRISDKL